MLLRIKALLRRAKIASERRIEIGEVCLNYDSRTVTRGEESVTLPHKEFLLLYKLLSYPGRVFTRIQIMDEVWGHPVGNGVGDHHRAHQPPAQALRGVSGV